MLSKAIAYLRRTGHVQGKGFGFFCFFGVASGSSQVVPGFSGLFPSVLACYDMFQVVPCFAKDDLTEYFDLQTHLNELHVRFYYNATPLFNNTFLTL